MNDRRGVGPTPCAAVGQAAVVSPGRRQWAQLCHQAPMARWRGPVARLALLANARELQQIWRWPNGQHLQQRRPAKVLQKTLPSPDAVSPIWV